MSEPIKPLKEVWANDLTRMWQVVVEWASDPVRVLNAASIFMAGVSVGVILSWGLK